MNKKKTIPAVILSALIAIQGVSAQSGAGQIRQIREAFPGEETAYRFALTDGVTSGGADSAKGALSLSGLPGDFEYLFTDSTDRQVGLTVGIPSAAAPGSYPFDVVLDQSGEMLREMLVIKSPDRISITPAEGTPATEAGKTLSVPLLLSNEGSLAQRGLTFAMETPVGWDVSLADKGLNALKPGERINTALDITIPESRVRASKR